MEMSVREIAGRYKRGTKLTVLAELNACPTAKIKEILESEGIEVPETAKKVTPESAIKQTIENPEKPKRQAAAVPEMPKAVERAVFDRLDTLENKMKYYKEQLASCEKEYIELLDALGIQQREGA